MYKLAQPFVPTYATTSIEGAIALVANFVSVTALDVEGVRPQIGPRVVLARSRPVPDIAYGRMRSLKPGADVQGSAGECIYCTRHYCRLGRSPALLEPLTGAVQVRGKQVAV